MVKGALYTKLLSDLRRFYKAHGRRHLPWRSTRDPYRILVSEMMLQQTQVDRVVPFYKKFIRQFPAARALAAAPLHEALAAWQGLGYNRRAKFLHAAAKAVAAHGWPKELEELPGVGPYTAGAISAFAFNRPEVFVETNIRTVLFNSGILENTRISKRVSDAELRPVVAELLKKSKMEPRDFYAALMDYGSYLKKQGLGLNSRSKHYVKQAKFEGSARQLRGAIVRELLRAPATQAALIKNLARTPGEVKRQLSRLQQEGLVEFRARRYRAARQNRP